MSGKRTITPEVEREVVRRYASGERAGALAKAFGINRKTITTIVRRNGAEVLSQQIAGGRRPLDTTPLHPRILELREQGWSQQQIAKEIGVSQPLVSRVLRLNGLPTVQKKRGSDHPAWRGGRTKTGEGYLLVYVDPSSRFASMRNRMGYIPEHRLVMAESLGRPLSKFETVHHINGDRSDNRPGNLQLRQGRHGAGVSLECFDCGSHNVGPVALKEAPLYACAECGKEAFVVDGAVSRSCDHAGVIVASAASKLAGRGGVR